MTCHEVKQDLALAAADSLDPARVAVLRGHCHTCPDCAEVWRAFQEIATACSNSATELESSPLHYRPTPSRAGVSRAKSRPPTPFLAWLVSGTVTALLVTALVLLQKTGPSLLAPSTQQQGKPAVGVTVAQPVPRETATAPSLALYRQALGRSGEDSLEALLARDANSLLRSASAHEIRDLNHDLF